MPEPDPSGLRVLVTRPVAQAQGLCEKLARLEAEPLAQPLLEIQPLPADSVRIDDLDHYNMLIFISFNAVVHGLARIGALPAGVQLGAIGRSTAEQLSAAGYTVSLVSSRQDSEGLLALPGLQALEDQEILIVRGVGGREKLAQTLRERGARVSYLEVYRRVPARWDSAAVNRALGADVITLTSGEALENLAQIARQPGAGALLDKPLIVIHERIAGRASELGFKLKPVVTDGPGDEAMLAALLQWLNERKGMRES